jgi:hypothetical protein
MYCTLGEGKATPKHRTVQVTQVMIYVTSTSALDIILQLDLGLQSTVPVRTGTINNLLDSSVPVQQSSLH